MKYSFKICVPFWVDIEDIQASTRVRNVLFIQEQIRRLTTFLKSKGNDVTFDIYDFSPEPVIPGAIHKPFPLGSFRKAEKWNLILSETHTDYFIGLDSDMFIHQSDFESFHELIQVNDKKQVMLFNTRCIQDHDVDKVDWDGGDVDNLLALQMHLYCSMGHTGTFGGLWVCPLHLIKNVGGFNENIKYRGDEDGELFTRITNPKDNDWLIENVKVNRILDIIPIHLPHIYRFFDPNYQSPNSHHGDWTPTPI
jgi:predicted glycosyltransferase involved in capsule biosynthesis